MVVFVRVANAEEAAVLQPADSIRLGFEARRVSRQRVTLGDGRPAGLTLARGTVLADGDVVVSDCGQAARVLAAPEGLSVARCPDSLTQARVAYHLGNRHACLMLGPGVVKYPADPVLDHMVQGLGVDVSRETAPFEPEAGAYEFTAADARLALLGSQPVVVRAAGQVAAQENAPAQSPQPDAGQEAPAVSSPPTGQAVYAQLPQPTGQAASAASPASTGQVASVVSPQPTSQAAHAQLLQPTGQDATIESPRLAGQTATALSPVLAAGPAAQDQESRTAPCGPRHGATENRRPLTAPARQAKHAARVVS